MTKIDTVVEDVYKLLESGLDGVSDDDIDDFGKNLARQLRKRLADREERSTLRMSNIGKPCSRQLWYDINTPEDKEQLDGKIYLKFLYGDILEELLLFLVKKSGHDVVGEQDEQEVCGIKGHRDAVIDGVLTDVKSASPYSFQKFKDGKLADNDGFGYIDQIQSYLYAGQTDDLVTDKDRAAFLVIDKVSGELCLDFHEREDYDVPAVFEYKKELVASDEPPAREFEPIEDGKSGNMKLGISCSYCPFKEKCFPELRTFLYSNGPRFLTTVEKEPKVPEVIDGEIILPEDKDA